MKTMSLLMLLSLNFAVCFAQKSLLSYDDVKFLLHNNLTQADSFLSAKGYTLLKKDNSTKNHKYAIKLPGGTNTSLSLRSDGKRLFAEIETNEIDQYNLIRESIAQYLDKNNQIAGVQTFAVKELGNIYITINDTVPYDALKKDYDIQIVSDKHITAYN